LIEISLVCFNVNIFYLHEIWLAIHLFYKKNIPTYPTTYYCSNGSKVKARGISRATHLPSLFLDSIVFVSNCSFNWILSIVWHILNCSKICYKEADEVDDQCRLSHMDFTALSLHLQLLPLIQVFESSSWLITLSRSQKV